MNLSSYRHGRYVFSNFLVVVFPYPLSEQRFVLDRGPEYFHHLRMTVQFTCV